MKEMLNIEEDAARHYKYITCICHMGKVTGLEP